MSNLNYAISNPFIFAVNSAIEHLQIPIEPKSAQIIFDTLWHQGILEVNGVTVDLLDKETADAVLEDIQKFLEECEAERIQDEIDYIDARMY